MKRKKGERERCKRVSTFIACCVLDNILHHILSLDTLTCPGCSRQALHHPHPPLLLLPGR